MHALSSVSVSLLMCDPMKNDIPVLEHNKCCFMVIWLQRILSN